METLQQLGAVLLVLGLLSVAVYGLRHKRMPNFARELRFQTDPKRLQVLERTALTPQHTLCLVRVDGRELIVTTAPNGCYVMPAADLTPKQ